MSILDKIFGRFKRKHSSPLSEKIISAKAEDLPIATFMLGGVQQTGVVLSRNLHTVWIGLDKGQVVKRHIIKHNVKISGPQEFGIRG